VNSFLTREIIVAFSALKHHTGFIVPIMENLEEKGTDVMYVIGQGENPQEITAKASSAFRREDSAEATFLGSDEKESIQSRGNA